MEQYMTWVNAHGGFLSLLFSAVVSFSTVCYVILTLKLANETRRLRKAQTEPLLSISIEPKELYINFLELRVQNIGLGPAYNIKLILTPQVNIGGELMSSRFPFLGLNYFRPGQVITSFLCSYNEIEPKEFQIKAIYENIEKQTIEESFPINLNQYLGPHRLGTPPLLKISENTLKIAINLERLINIYENSLNKQP